MFPIDAALLPSLATRKALLVVDAQNDFLAEDGALPVRMPVDLAQRISDLAGDFRRNGGEIIWVQSRFESLRPVDEEQIMISDTSSPSLASAPAPPRGRRSRTTPPATETIPVSSPEAFLTPSARNGPSCVRAGTLGIEMHPVVKQAVAPKDHVLTKTFYSAFRVEELVMLLRMRLVTELFICGSSTNIGVMATAIDAASYGYNITIVDDCCGSQSMSRHRTALRQIMNTAGCESLSAAKVLGMMRPKAKTGSEQTGQRQHRDRGAAGGRSPTVRVRRGMDDAVAPSAASDIQSSLERLSLSGQAAAADEYAPETPVAPPPPTSPQQQQRQRQRQPQSQSQSQPAVQSMARSGHPQTKNQRDRDTIIPPSPSPPPPPPSQAANGHVPAAGQQSATIPAAPTAATDSRGGSSTGGSGGKRPKGGRPSHESGRSDEQQGDTKVIHNILPAALADGIFTRLRSEVAWQRMSHQGGEVPRLVAVQGVIGADGSKPLYRHPADASPALSGFTASVSAIRRSVEGVLGHEVNHVLIQLYRTGEDYISEHSDKTLDIARDSFIANVSLGAERTMTLRTKRRRPRGGSDEEKDGLKRSVQRAALPHNSLFRMGLATNMRWLHGVRADKRLEREKSPAERAYGGARISLTFRKIATYLDASEEKIWGQGATSKTRGGARPVVNGQTAQAVAMLKAFGRENQDTEFDWAGSYGAGFDVLHIGDAKRLFLSGDAVVDLRVRAMLAEFGVSYARGSLGAEGEKGASVDDIPVRFVDNDDRKTAVDGLRDIMLYLQTTYGVAPAERDADRVRDRWTEALGGLEAWRSLSASENEENVAKLRDLFAPWEKYASEDVFIAGPTISLADFAFWPVLSHVFSSSPLKTKSTLLDI
ncbi:hypothetical protein F4803DRAFT_565246 [Xylaria telfairii]|nr:hypothetical protein F4803DRAFT_565246 [Xylaria telfairii]